jgi:hypothetical protein
MKRAGRRVKKTEYGKRRNLGPNWLRANTNAPR